MPQLLFRLLSTRLAPWLGRLARSNPTVLTSISNTMAKGGVVVRANAADIVNFARKNPINMALLVTTITSLGMDALSWLRSDDEQKLDPESAVFVENLRSARSPQPVTPTALPPPVSVKSQRDLLVRVADQTTGASVGIADKRIELATAQGAARWAVSAFGSRAGAANALMQLEYLLAMPVAEREAVFELIRLN